MNILMFSRSLKLGGALIVACSYLIISEYSVPSALVAAWIGVSLFTTSFFIFSESDYRQTNKAKAKQSKEIRSTRNREAEA